MKQLLMELDDETAARLERVAPARSRQRSEFIRSAIRKAIWDLEERATAEAYRRQPDLSPALVDAATWEAPAKVATRRRRRSPR